jgi:hypothetical protein
LKQRSSLWWHFTHYGVLRNQLDHAVIVYGFVELLYS